MSNIIAEAFSQSFPLAGSVTTTPETAVGEYQGSAAIDIHGAMTAKLTCFVSNVSALSLPESSTDVTMLVTPALEAAAAAAGAQVSAPAIAETPGQDAKIFKFEFEADGGPVQVWFSIEEAPEVAQSLDYDPAEVRRIENVSLDIAVVVGKTKMTIAEVLALKPGQVVDLDRAAGSPVDILVNGEHVAAGEVVVLDQDYGVKINRVIRMPKVH